MLSDSRLFREALSRPHIGGGYVTASSHRLPTLLRRLVYPKEMLGSIVAEADGYFATVVGQDGAECRNGPSGCGTYLMAAFWLDLMSSVGPDEVVIGAFERRLFGQTVIQYVMLPDVHWLADFVMQIADGGVRVLDLFAVSGLEFLPSLGDLVME